MLTFKKLQFIGFSEKESEVYTMLNKMGPTPASVLARLTSINRTTIYAILNKLEEKGLVLWYKQNGTIFYTLDDIKKLASREREQLAIAEDLVRELELEQGGSSTVQVQYYRGKEGVKELLEDILKAQPKQLAAFINSGYIHSELGETFMKDWITRRIKNKIFARLLLEDCEETRLYQASDQSEYRETRIFPEKYTFDSGCYLFEDNICLFDSSDSMLAVRIKSKNLAQMYFQTFEFMWDMVGISK